MKAILASTMLIGLLLAGSVAPRQIDFGLATPVGMLALQNGGVVTATVEGQGRGFVLHLAYFEPGQTPPKAETLTQELSGFPARTTLAGCDTSVHVMMSFPDETSSLYSWSWASATTTAHLPLVCSP